MTERRVLHTATILADGKVLSAGGGNGWCGSTTSASAEVYDPATQQFGFAGPMSAARSGHTATRLADGTVLITGGMQYWPAAVLAAAEVYLPPAIAPAER
jgi:hypothetical protein